MEAGNKREEEVEELDDFGHLQTGSFMELLGCGNLLSLEKNAIGEDRQEDFIFPPTSLSSFPCSSSTIQMLCFGGAQADRDLLLNGLQQISSESSLSTLSSSPSSTPTSRKSKTPRKVNAGGGGGGGRGRRAAAGSGAAATTTSRRTRKETSGPVRVRKERLVAERIASLQQLLSPSDKLDAATVLHEAREYIKSLHDQVQVLSSPCLQRLPPSDCLHAMDGKGLGVSREDLRSSGLCLVPVSYATNVGDGNGADICRSRTVGRSSTSSNSGSKH